MRVRVGLGHTGAQEIDVLRVTLPLVSFSAGLIDHAAHSADGLTGLETQRFRRPLYVPRAALKATSSILKSPCAASY